VAKEFENIYEQLETEIKKEIIENYYTEKLYLEEKWYEYQEILKELKEKEKKLVKTLANLSFLLNDPFVLEKLEKLLGIPISLLLKENGSSFFQKIPLAFAFTKKGKFKKAVLKVYENFYKTAIEYLKKFKEAKAWYEKVKTETESFHKNFDIKNILNFFSRLEASPSESVEDKIKACEELSQILKIPIPESPEKSFPFFTLPPSPKEIKSELFKLAELYFKKHPEEAEKKLAEICQ